MKTIKYKGIDETIYYEKLPNGLEIYMYPSDTAKNFYLTFNTRFGSMDTEFKLESDKKFTTIPHGTAHFLEHQMFQEDGEENAFQKYAKLGSSINAFTTYNLTCYEVIASDNFKENLELLLDYVQNPVFKSASVSKEKNIIKEEIKMYDNNPNAKSNFGLEYNLNNKDNHKYLISGTEEDIKRITPEILENTYDVFYHPSNMFLVLSGRFKPLEALGIIKENQNKKDFKESYKIIRKRPKEPLKVSNPYESINLSVTIPKIRMAYKLDKKTFKGYSDLELRIYLDTILTIKFGSTSDILEHLTDSNLITWDIYTSRSIRDDYILITLGFESDYPSEVIDLIREELSNIKITKEEINRIKKYSISNFIFHFNDNISIAEDIQDDIISSNKIETDIMDEYNNLNVKDANVVASNINLDNECIYIVDKLND